MKCPNLKDLPSRAYAWHRKPQTLTQWAKCPICGFPLHNRVEHRAVGEEEGELASWYWRRKSPQGWQVVPVFDDHKAKPRWLSRYRALERKASSPILPPGPTKHTRETIARLTSLIAAGETSRQAAGKLGISQGAITYYRNRYAGLWTESLKANVEALAAIVRSRSAKEGNPEDVDRQRRAAALLSKWSGDEVAVEDLPEDSLSAYCRDHYLPDRVDIRPGSIAELRLALRQLDAWHRRPVLLAEISKPLLTAWLRFLHDAGAAAPTVNHKRALVLAVWRHAADNGFCDPVPRIRRLSEPQRMPVVWQVEDVGRILAVCRAMTGAWGGVPVSLCWQIAFGMLWDTGCRLAELLMAKVSDVDLVAGNWFVCAENRKGRRRDRLYRLHPDTLALIRASLTHPHEMVFPWPRCRRRIWKHLRGILLVAGLPTGPRRGFHCIRRTVESYAAAARGDQWAADAIGHSVEVARRSYISPAITGEHRLIDAIPRPMALTRPVALLEGLK